MIQVDPITMAMMCALGIREGNPPGEAERRAQQLLSGGKYAHLRPDHVQKIVDRYASTAAKARAVIEAPLLARIAELEAALARAEKDRDAHERPVPLGVKWSGDVTEVRT